MSMKDPHLSRKLLGEWLPIVVRGRRVAQAVGGGLTVPATIIVSRSGGRKTQEHSYGTIDLPLEEGEPLSIKVSSPANPDAPSIEGTLPAAATSERREIKFADCGMETDATLDWLLHGMGIMQFGGIT